MLTASLTTVGPAVLERGPGRIWQGVRGNGANVLTITGGHAIDALCVVLGEVADVSARVSTRIPEWRTLEGKAVPVDSPDSINVVGRMVSGAEASISLVTAPSNPSGNRLEIYGRVPLGTPFELGVRATIIAMSWRCPLILIVLAIWAFTGPIGMAFDGCALTCDEPCALATASVSATPTVPYISTVAGSVPEMLCARLIRVASSLEPPPRAFVLSA